MKKVLLILFAAGMVCFTQATVSAQAHPCTGWGGYTTDGDEIPCGDAQFPCCDVYNACNGTNSPCPNYDPDFSADGGCDLSCTPIDSGVLFLLLGGAAFGGMMIIRRRQEALEVINP